MSLFICEKCGSIENTALGHYWTRHMVSFGDLELDGKALCSACIPECYVDGLSGPAGQGAVDPWAAQRASESEDVSS